MVRRPVRVLTVAGSDSGGGAGIQADLKTFYALGAHGLTAVAALTAQHTRGVTAARGVSPALVAAQIEAVAGDIGVDAAKTGMLWSEGVVRAVAESLRRLALPRLVVDPVLTSSTGAPLLSSRALTRMKADLLPLAAVVTPNALEAAVLAGLPEGATPDLREAARRIAALGPAWVVITGGHPAAGPRDPADPAGPREATDLLFDGRTFTDLRGPWLTQRHTHGTGCTFSAALAVGLAEGLAVPAAAARAKSFVAAAIAGGYALGDGPGPVNHWAAARSARCAGGGITS